MFLYLFTKVVDSYIDVLHSIGNEAINIMVNDALTSYFEKRLWCLLSKRTKALSLATCHQDGIDGKFRLKLLEIDHIHHMILAIENWDEHDATIAE